MPLPVREAVESILAARGAAGIHLRVAHTHSHGDHIFGDRLLAARPNTEIVGADLESVRAAFGIDGWPDGAGSIDLGNRRLTVFPIPGHEPAHVAFHDEATRTLFSGDLLYPGLLTVRDWPAYRASAARMAAFARVHPVSWVLGCHIEMSREPGRLYPLGTTWQPDEHVLQLGPEHVEELHEVCEALGDAPRAEVTGGLHRPASLVRGVESRLLVKEGRTWKEQGSDRPSSGVAVSSPAARRWRCSARRAP